MNESSPRHRWFVLTVVGLAQLMVVLDATIVNIALPSAQADLGFSNGSRQWVITAYALAFGSLLLLGGRLSDPFGRKWTFIGGLLGFAGASAIGGFAPSFAVLVGARVAQGAFAALLAPAALSLLSTTFADSPDRGKAFGIYGAISGGGGAAGLLLGGFLTEYLSWRWCLFVNLVLALPVAITAVKLLVNRAAAAGTKIDGGGTLSVTTGLFALVFGFSNAETHGWGAPLTVSALAGGIVLLATFIAIERRVEHPLLPMRVLADRNRSGSYIAVGIAGAGLFGVFLFLTYYLQQNLGFTPVQTGLAFLPMVAALALTSTTVNTLVLARTGPRPLVPTGMALAAIAMFVLTFVGVDSSYGTAVLPALVLLGIGIGLTLAPAMAGATLGVADADAGVASAMVSTSQQVGGSIATALLSTLAASATSSFVASHPKSAAALAEASVHGYTTAFWWAAGIFAVGALVTGLLLRSGAPKQSLDAAPLVAH